MVHTGLSLDVPSIEEPSLPMQSNVTALNLPRHYSLYSLHHILGLAPLLSTQLWLPPTQRKSPYRATGPALSEPLTSLVPSPTLLLLSAHSSPHPYPTDFSELCSSL